MFIFLHILISTDVILTTYHRPSLMSSSTSIPTVVGTYRYMRRPPNATPTILRITPLCAYRYIKLRRPSPTPIPTIAGSAYDTSRRPTIVGSAYDTSRRQQHGTSSHSLTLVRNVLRRRQYNQQYGGASVWMCPLCCLQEDV